MRLEPTEFEKNQWQKQLVAVTVKDGDRVTDYQGYVLTAVADGAHDITFAVKTSALRPAEIDIPLQFSAGASVKLFVNDELIDTLSFPKSEDPSVIHRLTKDITTWTEGHESSRLQLLISYFGQKETTTVFLGTHKSDLQPKLHQKWSWSYGLQSLSFFAFGWSSIIALAIVLVAHIKPLGDTFRFYAVLFAVVSWAAGILGLPDAAKIPLRPMLRSLYRKTKPRRVMWVVSLFLLFVVAGSGAGTIVYCLGIRHYYSTLIYRAHEEANPAVRQARIRQAISLLPWRKEAHMLFERDAYAQRDLEEMGNFRQYIRDFALDQNVKQAIINAPDEDNLPWCLTKTAGSNFLNDPVIWYASTIVEGDGFEETQLMNEAVSLLATRKDPIAQIQLRNTELESLVADTEAEDSEVDEKADELRQQLEQNYESRGTHVYQAACDTLAFYYLRNCDLETASKWYGRELSARKHQANDGDPRWLRPPDKLMLFYMFASYWNMKGEAVRGASCLLDTRFCNPPAPDEESCNFKSMFEERLRNPNKDYWDESAWTKNTIRENGLKLGVALENSLKKGWRY